VEVTRDAVFITGATGLIGGALARRLLAEGEYEVRVLARAPQRAAELASLGATVLTGDITRADTLGGIEGARYVVHSAAWVSDYGRDEDIVAANVDGSRNVARACADARVEKLVHMSSVAVYGASDEREVDETSPAARSGSAYHDSKVDAELVVADEVAKSRHELRHVSLRASHVFGPRSTHFTIRPIKMLLKRQLFVIDGGRHFFKPVYIDNLVDATTQAMTVDTAPGLTVNVTDGYVLPWRDLFARYADMLELPHRWLDLPAPVATLIAGGVERVCDVLGRKPPITPRTIKALSSRSSYSNEQAKAALQWTPAVDLDAAIGGIATWLARQGGAKSLLRKG